MSSELISILPFELWSFMIGYLNLRDLSNLSLASHEWQNLALPRLHRIVYLACGSHLQRFSEQLANNPNGSVSEHLRGLVLDNGPGTSRNPGSSISQDDMQALMRVLMASPNLDYFSWELFFVPQNEPIIGTIQICCPKLRSFHFSAGESYSSILENNPQTFNFKNLLHFSFDGRHLPDENAESYVSSLSSLIRESPDIRTVKLVIDRFGVAPPSSASLCAHLEDMRFGSLHTLHGINLTAEPDFFRVFDSSHRNALRTFLLRHPGLRSLGLGWAAPPTDYVPIDSSDVEALLPSLTSLEAPTFLCAPVLSSRLAAQIESIAVVDRVGYLGLQAQFDKFVHSTMAMPNLKSLAIEVHDRRQASWDAVGELLRHAPGLEELGLGVPFDVLDDIIKPLRLVPKIYKLNILPSQLDLMHLETGEYGWRDCLSVIASICPDLLYVHELGPICDETSYWMINRGEQGVEVTSVDARNSEQFRICGIL